MKGLIKHLLREDMNTHVELQNLADSVFMASVRYFVNETIDKGTTLNILDRVQDMFSKINRNKYSKLGDFVKEYDLGFRYSGSLSSLGDFVAHNETSGDIIVRYELAKLQKTIEDVVFPTLKSGKQINQEIYNQMCNQVHGRLYDRKVLSTILHELQHAYDSWRSQGMFMASKRGYDYDKEYSNLPKGTPITQKQRDEYDKLEYEINARFTQAIKEIQFYITNTGMDKNKPNGYLTPVPFSSVKSQFENNFGAYEKMTPNFRKRLMRRLSQAYHQILDRVSEHNKNLSSGEINENTPLITENAVGRHLIVVDVQPEYAPWMGGMQTELFEYINTHVEELSDLTFLYNGEDTMGMVSEYDYRDWLIENGLDEEIAYQARLYDKGYAFFRNCMDRGGDDEELVNLVKFMRDNDINDSRELDKKFWKAFVKQYGSKNIRELMEDSEDCINIPDLMDFLEPYNNVVLVGGGINECLKEVELAMDALEKNYDTWHKFTY
jgi:hypothetical protein